MVINVYDAKTHLSKLIDRAANGEHIILGKSGKPLALLVPYSENRQQRVPGRLVNQITIADDFDQTPDWVIDSFDGTNETTNDDASSS